MTAERDLAAPWLAAHRADVLAAWRRLLAGRLPGKASLFGGAHDPFANPIGYRVAEVTGTLLDGLAHGAATEALAAAMEPLMRVQAIQGAPASEAVAFVPLLHSAARQVPGGIPDAEAGCLRNRLDTLLLAAFDVYSRCREDIFEIRVREARRRLSARFDRLDRGDACVAPYDSGVTS